VHGDDNGHLTVVDDLWHVRCSREGQRHDEGGDLVGHRRHVVPPPAFDVREVLQRVEDTGEGDDRAHRVQPESERGDDAEVPAATADRPVQVRLTVSGYRPNLPVRAHDLRLNHVVTRQPILAAEMSVPAAQCEATNARLGHPAQRGGESERLRLPVHITQHGATLDADKPPFGINLHAAHRG
jgi:hypothetical protein